MTMENPNRKARSVTICICTFRRPDVEHTLASLNGLDIPVGVSVDVLVVDNDVAPTAIDLIDRVRPRSKFPIAYIHAPASNISIARNACLEGASGRFIAFLDDDEIATVGWLRYLFTQAEASGAAVVLGPVRARYGPDAPRWMSEGDFHSTQPVFVRGRIVTGYSGNALIDREASAIAGLRFDVGKGKSGGEDTDFFHRIHIRGGLIDFAPEAWVDEDVPAGRASMGWLVKRRFRMGQTHGQVLGETRVGVRRLAAVGVALAKFSACNLLASRHILSPVERRRSVLRGVLHAGAISGLVGMQAIQQYGGEKPASAGNARAA